jgi:hypothetical protein
MVKEPMVKLPRQAGVPLCSRVGQIIEQSRDQKLHDEWTKKERIQEADAHNIERNRIKWAKVDRVSPCY